MKKHCAGLIVILFSLVAFSVAYAGFDGVIDPRGTVTDLDSAVLTAPDTTYITPGWGSHTPLDTFYFFGAPLQPASITLHGTVDSFPVRTTINHPKLDTWYAISMRVVTSTVMFTEYPHPGADESKPVDKRLWNLDISPSVVTGQMTIRLQPATRGKPIVEIHDAVGSLVRSLGCTAGSDGIATATWNREDEHGRLVPEGVYFCRYAAGDVIAVRKILVAR